MTEGRAAELAAAAREGVAAIRRGDRKVRAATLAKVKGNATDEDEAFVMGYIYGVLETERKVDKDVPPALAEVMH